MSSPKIGYDDTQVAILDELKAHRYDLNIFSRDVIGRLAVLETTINVVPTINERVRILELFKYQLMGITIGSSTVISAIAALVGWAFRGAR